MEIRQVLRGNNTGFAPARPAGSGGKKTDGFVRPSADRLELSQSWVGAMEEQRVQAESALLAGAKKKSDGILDMLDGPDAEEQERDALSKQMDTQMKCLKIAMNIMRGKKVPPEDERFLMENDPEGYKLAIAMRQPPKKDDKECESVLKDEDKEGNTSETQQSAPAEGCEAASGGGDALASGGGEAE